MNTIVITGASSGIGLETARILTLQGFNVLGVSRSESNCNRAKERILTENPNAKIIPRSWVATVIYWRWKDVNEGCSRS